MAEGFAERPSTAMHYFSQDFKWEDLRDEVQSRPKGSDDVLGNLPVVSLDHNVEAWKKFHHLHAKHAFFKERRYLVKEFPDLLASDRVLNILEVGCGTGSSVLPILRANKAAVVYACDCSESVLRRAHSLVQTTISSDGNCRFVPFLCDISIQRLPSWLCCSSCMDLEGIIHEDSISSENGERLHCINGIDIITMIFTLSSIPPHQMQHVIEECFSVLKPGGLVLFRDYGLYDMTMQRFSATQRVGEQLYQRGDGTLTFFFTPESLSNLFVQAGFVEEENYFCCVEVRNRRRELPMKRVWIHAKFIKPQSPS
ncbi:hypothetical protein GOP47_0000011 [Adiantum capillus-veneris]|uniref:tRNA N(3)-methylcytidine methyltransferase n=1 Tax=Adiantum capillus-veneris TaxID=13818 RepID=A0A9D4ZSF9_ADICA|nr:hypothetical protein GOP47_0000011 [Adiantum capillus-veneris]